MRIRHLFLLTVIWTGALAAAFGQRVGFLDHIRIGFGGGANAAMVIPLDGYAIFEDLEGNTYGNSYTGLIQNIGNQYFAQLEWYNDHVVVTVKPGTYTYRFHREQELIFSSGSVEDDTPYLLRYFTLPVEVRYNLDLQRFRPYAGVAASYGHLLQSNDASNRSFIRPRFSAGAVAGTYVDLRSVILDLNVGYMAGLHNITSKADRFGSGSGETFAQDDLLLNHLQVSLSVLFSLQKQRRTGSVECYY